MSNPAGAAADKVKQNAEKAVKQTADKVKSQIDGAMKKINNLKSLSNIASAFNLGGLASKLWEVRAGTILSLAVPDKILPTTINDIIGSMGTIDLLNNVHDLTKKAKEISSKKSGLPNEETDPLEEAQEAKAQAQEEAEARIKEVQQQIEEAASEVPKMKNFVEKIGEGATKMFNNIGAELNNAVKNIGNVINGATNLGKTVQNIEQVATTTFGNNNITTIFNLETTLSNMASPPPAFRELITNMEQRANNIWR